MPTPGFNCCFVYRHKLLETSDECPVTMTQVPGEVATCKGDIHMHTCLINSRKLHIFSQIIKIKLHLTLWPFKTGINKLQTAFYRQYNCLKTIISKQLLIETSPIQLRGKNC